MKKYLFTTLLMLFAFILAAQPSYKIESFDIDKGLKPRAYNTMVKAHINKGYINQAIYAAASGLRTSDNKRMNIKFHEILNDHYQLTLTNNLEEIVRLKANTKDFKNDRTINDLAKIVNIYNIMDKYNDVLKMLPKDKFLPIKKKDKGLKIGDFQNFKNELGEAKVAFEEGVKMAAKWHYENANEFLAIAKKNGNKDYGKNACLRYRYAVSYIPNYKDCNQKIDESIEYGTTKLAVLDFENRSDDFPSIDNELMEAIRAEIKNNKEKFEFFKIVDKNLVRDYDLALKGTITDGAVNKSQGTDKKEHTKSIKVGTEEYTTKAGKKATRDKMESVTATAALEHKSQKATLKANVLIEDAKKVVRDEKEIIGTDNWSTTWVTGVTGNKKALPNTYLYEEKSNPSKDKSIKKASISVAKETIKFINQYGKQADKIEPLPHLISLTQELKQSSQIKDGDGNVYEKVVIGTQEWLTSDLRTKSCNDGTPLPLLTAESAQKSFLAPGYMWYKDDEQKQLAKGYGALYSGYTVSENSCNICPVGWNVPTYSELKTVVDYFPLPDTLNLDEATGVIAKMRDKMGWAGEYGGSFFPNMNPEEFIGLGEAGYWWTKSKRSDNEGEYYLLSDKYPFKVLYLHFPKELMASVRCVKENTIKKEDVQKSITVENLHGKWILTLVNGKTMAGMNKDLEFFLDGTLSGNGDILPYSLEDNTFIINRSSGAYSSIEKFPISFLSEVKLVFIASKGDDKFEVEYKKSTLSNLHEGLPFKFK